MDEKERQKALSSAKLFREKRKDRFFAQMRSRETRQMKRLLSAVPTRRDQKHPNDPLTRKQFREYMKSVSEAIETEYRKALSSGAFPESCFVKSSHLILNICVAKAAAKFRPKTPEFAKLAKNYDKF